MKKLTSSQARYKEYIGQFDVSVDDGVIHGRVIGIRDMVIFEGETVSEALQSFHESVDAYLEFCSL